MGEFVGVVWCRGTRRPRGAIIIVVGSVAMTSSSGFRGDSVAASRDDVFENRVVLPLDAQIDGGLF